MTPGQNDAAMIHLRWGQRWMILAGESGSLNQCPAAGRTPIRHGLFAEHRPALAANPFHTSKITGFSRCRRKVCLIIDFLIRATPKFSDKLDRFRAILGVKKSFFRQKKGIFRIFSGHFQRPNLTMWEKLG